MILFASIEKPVACAIGSPVDDFTTIGNTPFDACGRFATLAPDPAQEHAEAAGLGAFDTTLKVTTPSSFPQDDAQPQLRSLLQASIILRIQGSSFSSR
jgi:hypothetical protein